MSNTNQKPHEVWAAYHKREKEPMTVTMPREDWHIICGWLESIERDAADVKAGKKLDLIYIPTSVAALTKHLREDEFPV